MTQTDLHTTVQLNNLILDIDDLHIKCNMEFTIKTLDADNEPSSVHSYQYIPVVIKDGNTVELDIDRLRHMAKDSIISERKERND